jgi:hypothetical protein
MQPVHIQQVLTYCQFYVQALQVLICHQQYLHAKATNPYLQPLGIRGHQRAQGEIFISHLRVLNKKQLHHLNWEL